MNWFIEVVTKKYAAFSGRARRTEYWMFVLFFILIAIGLGIVDALIGTGGILYGIFALGLLVPSIAVCIRRLHDTGRSGWWILISFVPLVGGIVLLVFMCMDSTPGANEYGPNPKGVGTAPATA
jgi:uncharacterized membrane protein YhaH (DUF805 family)